MDSYDNCSHFVFLRDCHGRWLGSRLGQSFTFSTFHLFIARYGAVLKTYGTGNVGFGCSLLGGQTVDLDMPLAAMGRLSGERARRVRLSFWMRPFAFRGGRTGRFQQSHWVGRRANRLLYCDSSRLQSARNHTTQGNVPRVRSRTRPRVW